MANVIGSLKVLLGLDAAEYTAGLSKADAQAAKFADKQRRNAAGIDKTIASLQRQADQLGKTTREIKLMELAQRGATQEQLRAADAALRTSERYHEMQAAAGLAKVAATALGVAAAAGLVSILDSQTKALDAFNDLSDATGASVENISALDGVARRTGATFEDVETILLRFAKAIKDAKPDDDVGRTIAALGLNLDALKAEDRALALQQVAAAMGRFGDDTAKADASLTLFGKTTGQAAPFLKDLAESGQLVATATREQAQEAERYQRNLAALGAGATDLARKFAGELAPQLSNIIEAFRAGSDEGTGFASVLARGVGIAAETLAVLGANVAFVFQGAGREIGAVGAQIAALARGDIQGFRAISDAVKEDAARARAQLDALEQRILNPPKAKVPAPAGEDRPSLRVPIARAAGAAGTGRSTAARIDEAQRYLETLQRQLARTGELGAAEQALAELQSGRLGKVSAALQSQILLAAQQIDNARSAAAAEDEAARAAEAREEATRRQRLAMQSETEGIERDNLALRDEITVLRGGEEARRAIAAATLSSAIAVKEDEAARLRALGTVGDEVAALEAQIALLRERQDLLGQRTAAEAVAERMEETKALADELGQTFADAFGRAAAGGESLRGVLDALGKDLLSLTTRKLVTEPLGELFSTGAKGLLGGGGGFGSLFAGVSNLFSGAGSAFPVGFANGGRVGAGIFEVAENRPEVLDVGGRKFLLSKQAGTIDPAPQLNSRSRTVVNAPVTITMPANTSAQTANQAGAAVARRILAVNRRYN